MKKIQLSVLGVAMSVILTGCATTTGLTSTDQITSKNPKDALTAAFKSQLRTSFGYATTVYPSNEWQRDALNSASLAMATCESAHDEAYVAMLKNSSDDINDDTSLQIKENYQQCLEARSGVANYQPFDFEKFYESAKHLDKNELATALQASMMAHADAQLADKDGTERQVTALDVKKAELVNEYLIKSSKTTVTGNYQPLSGVFTALPSLSYDSKNLKATVNQPIYVDLKAGVIYLWADNFGLINSQLTDKTLGDKWRNKWLAIPLNDGSLPKDFVKDFAKAYAHAKTESLDALGNDDVKWVSADTVLALPYFASNIDETTKSAIAKSESIIQKSPNESALAYSRYVFNDTLYGDLTAKYPELEFDVPAYHAYDIADGESRINISAPIGLENTDEADKIERNSKTLVGLFLRMLKNRVNHYYANLPALKDAPKNEHAPIWHYGIQSGRISWLHERRYLTSDLPARLNGAMSKDTPVFIDTITIISPNAKHEFDRLPADVRTPNASNSIDALKYGKELLERLQKDEIDLLQMGDQID